MNAVISRLERAAGADALVRECDGNTELTDAVLKYLLGQIAYGIDAAAAVESALRWIAQAQMDAAEVAR